MYFSRFEQRLLKPIFIGGLIAGTLDLIAAFMSALAPIGVVGALIIMFCVGLPIALVVRRFSK